MVFIIFILFKPHKILKTILCFVVQDVLPVAKQKSGKKKPERRADRTDAERQGKFLPKGYATCPAVYAVRDGPVRFGAVLSCPVLVLCCHASGAFACDDEYVK